MKKTIDRTSALLISLGLIVAIQLLLPAHTTNAWAQEGDLSYGLSPAYGKPVAPPLDLPGLDGKQYRLSENRGKVVIVNFWATWCPPCIAEMPTLQEAWNRFQGANFEILAVNLGEDAETIQRFLDRFEPELKFPVLMASDQSIMEAWKIQALPMSYIIDKDGRLIYIELGPRDFSHEHVISKLRELMDASADD